MVSPASGSIVPIGSVNSFTPEADVPGYAATKGGVLLVTKSLVRDSCPLGIRVNGIALGRTNTPWMRKAIARVGLDEGTPIERFPSVAARLATRSRCSRS
jgi:NAD(P)-dependent dehydrogenase (short-subunit alcohol dehydrogenase family)